MIVGFLLVLWINRLPLMQEELREIPADMQEYISSPARHLPDVSLNTKNKLALTNGWFNDKWSFVYFSHGQCLPACLPILTTLRELKSGLANKDVQFLVIGIDSENETAEQLDEFLIAQRMDATSATASTEMIDQLARYFIALFLKTDFSDGSYQIEQEHHVFLVDPKGRVYATFMPPYLSSAKIKEHFLKLRRFYAKTE